MDTLQYAVQLTEDVTYPDGYNVVEIEGMGDVPRLEYIPKITLVVSPGVIASDGVSRITCVATIADPNNPDFDQLHDKAEVVDAPNQEFQTGEYCAQLTQPATTPPPYSSNPGDGQVYTDYQAWCSAQETGVWEFISGSDINDFVYGHLLEITSIGGDRRTVRFTNPYWYTGPDGQQYQLLKVICKYKGRLTVSWSVGGRDRNGDGTVDEMEADGTSAEFFLGVEKTSESPIANNRSTIYALPTAGGSGQLTIHASYAGVEAYAVVEVTVGWYGDASITLSADPTSLAVGHKSVLTAHVVNSAGKGADEVPVVFSIIGGPGRLTKTEVLTEAQDGEEEDVDTSVEILGDLSKRWSFSVSHPIEKITAIEPNAALNPPAWTWEGTMSELSIQGSTVKFPIGTELPLDNYPLTVTYNWAGVAVTEYIATANADPVIVSAKIKDTTRNALATLTVSEDAVAGSLTLTADPSSVAKLGESTLQAVYIDGDGQPAASGNVRLHFARGGGDMPLSIRLGTKDIDDEITSSSSRREVSTQYPIYSIQHVKYPSLTGDNYYTGGSFDGTTITLGRDLPAPGLEVSVTYTATGLGECTFTARNIDEVVDIFGIGPAPDHLRASCRITVGNPGQPNPATLTFTETAPNPMKAGRFCVVRFTLLDSNDTALPSLNNYATISVVEGRGLLFPAELTEPPTGMFWQDYGKKTVLVRCDQDGNGIVSYYAPPDIAEEVKLTGRYFRTDETDPYYSESEASTTINVKLPWRKFTVSTKSVGSVTLKIDPKTKREWVSAGSHIVSSGAAVFADDYANFNGDPLAFPARVQTSTEVHLGYGEFLVGQQVSGGGTRTVEQFGEEIPMASVRLTDANIDANHDGTAGSLPLSLFDVSIDWSWVQDDSTVTLRVVTPSGGLAHDPETGILQAYGSDVPIPYAEVTINGETQLTDITGNVTFANLPPGTHSIYVNAPNYKLNRAPQEGGTTDTVDSNVANDTVTIPERVRGMKVLLPMEVTYDLSVIIGKAVPDPDEQVGGTDPK